MRGIPAVNSDAEMTRRTANVLITDFAGGALPASDPRIHGNPATGLYGRVRSCRIDLAGNFVTKREWQRAPGSHIKLFFSAEHKVTILHMQVGMADTTAFHPHQHFGSLRLRYVRDGFAEGRSVSGQ
jgi:hypothetical protein